MTLYIMHELATDLTVQGGAPRGGRTGLIFWQFGHCLIIPVLVMVSGDILNNAIDCLGSHYFECMECGSTRVN